MLRPHLLSLLAGAVIGCGCPSQTPSPTTTDAPGIASSAPRVVPVDPLTPQPIRVTVDGLPAPFATDSARKGPQVVPMPQGARLKVPAGFVVQIWAEGLDKPRWLALTPEGDVLVTETRQNRIQRLRDADGDGAAEHREVFATSMNGLDIPFGMAFVGERFFLGNSHEVRRYPYVRGQALQGEGERIAELPGGGYNQHWTRNVIPSADGEHLYVSIGSATNVEVEPLPRASVQRIDLDGGNMTTVGSGLRNPVGLAVHPRTGTLYATVNERDALGDDLVPDYFTSVKPGAFYGWPYAYLRADKLDPRRTQDGESEDPERAAATVTPDVLFQAHSAALGLAFYDHSAFPARYRGGAFACFRGSWNRDRGTGYKLVFIPFEGDAPVGHYEDFLTGFLLDPSGPTTWGRPVGLLALPDGSLLFTEEMNGRIFRVSYPASSGSGSPTTDHAQAP